MSRRIKIRRESESFFGGALWFAVCPDGRDLNPADCGYTVHTTHRQAVDWVSDHLRKCHV